MADDLSDIDAAFGAPTRSSGSAPVDDMSDIDAAFGNVTLGLQPLQAYQGRSQHHD